MASAVTVVVRQAGFALGIAVLGMLLDPANPTGGFSWLFAAATVASLGGVAGGLLLLPRQAAGQSIGGDRRVSRLHKRRSGNLRGMRG